MSFLRKLRFEYLYLGKPRWDTGISPPELHRFIAEHPPGRALDLGCGTGTNIITLAQAGWDATGVDFSHLAVRDARRKSRDAGVTVKIVRDDVSRPKKISGNFDLILDLGCFHGLRDHQLEGYAQCIDRRLAPDGTFLLFVYFRKSDEGPPGITETLLAETFAGLVLTHREEGDDARDWKPAAWLWYRKPAAAG